jgi:hypothetical protein
MKKEDVEMMLQSMDIPRPEEAINPHELKIPLLSYRKSSRAGFWLLLVPFTMAITVFLKSELGVNSAYMKFTNKLFSSIESNAVLTYLIPVLFFGLPLIAMVMNFLAICHFQKGAKNRELIITIKYRPLNILLFLVSLALLIFFLLPDKLAF